MKKALAASLDAAQATRLRTACGGDEALLARVRPFAGLIREDSFGRPVVIATGAVYVTQGAERRKTGTHYTPTSLTEPIVRHTLEPVVYRGPAEGKPREAWALIPLGALLQVKVLDLAMGSGAFLVQSCRYLAARLVEAVDADVVLTQSRKGAEVQRVEEQKDSAPSPLRAFALNQDSDEALYTLASSTDPTERMALAMRLVAERCLYGVDKNPLAVEMAKLSLWLLLLDGRRPFSFLDHALRSGDSLLGLSDLEQLLNWSLRRVEVDGQQVGQYQLIKHHVEEAIERALALRRRIRNEQVRPERKAAWLREAEEKMALVRLGADLLVAATLHPDKSMRQSKLLAWQSDYSRLMDGMDDLRRGVFRPESQASADTHTLSERLRREADALLDGRRPFHWPLELPEVFLEERREAPGTQLMLDAFTSELAPLFAGDSGGGVTANDSPGFSAIVGNPPFQGGQKITGALGVPYRDYLVETLAGGQRGSADLCAYFFLRVGGMLRHDGMSGLVATNTIAQGDTREVGLDQLVARGFSIPRAVPSRPWPGLAAVEVAHIWLRRGAWHGSFTLNDQPVAAISPFLTVPGATIGTPYRLKANEESSFIGSYVLGLGFVLTPEEAAALIAKDSRNCEALFPYLNGEDLNSRPDQSPSRWVINFHDWPLEKAESYPDLMAIVRTKVKPEREKLGVGNPTAKDRSRRWWQFARQTMNLYARIARMERVLVVARITKYIGFVFVPMEQIYNEKIIVVTDDGYVRFAVLQSELHEIWARTYSSTLETRLNYTPSDCFETFPFPACLQAEPLTQRGKDAEAQSEEASETSAPSRLSGFALKLESIGEQYHEHRQHIMRERQEGLTKTYNRFHAPGETAADITELRRLHVELDNAVAATYGWQALDLGHGFHETKQGVRYTISEAARRAVLDRLLALNHARHAEEARAGVYGGKGSGIGGRGSGKRREASGAVVSSAGAESQSAPQPPALAPQLGLNLFGTPGNELNTAQIRTDAGPPADPQSLILDPQIDAYARLTALLAARGALTNGEAQAALGVDGATARALLKRLVDEGLARVEGQRRGTRYVRAEGET